jgi:hypothetical protein
MQIGTGLLEQIYAASIKLEATVHQTEQVLTIAARGPGFALDETLYLDGRTRSERPAIARSHCPQDKNRLVRGPQAACRDSSDQNQTGKTGPTDHHKVPDKRREKHGGCLHPKSSTQNQTKPLHAKSGTSKLKHRFQIPARHSLIHCPPG